MTATDLTADVPLEQAQVAAANTRAARLGRWFRDLGWRHLVALLALVFALFPVLWIVSASFNPTGSLASQQVVPSHPTLDNYRSLLTDPAHPYLTWFANSMVVAGATSIATVLLAAMAAYAFSRFRFRGRRIGLLSLLLIQMFPQLLAVVAIFLLMTSVKGVFPEIGLGTKTGLILVYLGGAMGVNTWLMKGFFDTIPKDLDESARVDGATHAQIFLQIVLPLAVPILAVIALLSFIFTLNEFIIASALLRDTDNYTLSVGLYGFVSERFSARWGPFAAGALIAGIPIIVVWQVLQRYIVSGLTQGAVKG